MSEQPQTRRRIDLNDLVRTLMKLQVAISKLIIELISTGQDLGPVYQNENGDPVREECGWGHQPAGEECGPPQYAVNEECGPKQNAVNEECGPAQVSINEECLHPNYLDEDCLAPSPVPEVHDRSSVEMLCEQLEEITRYLKKICKIVRT